MTAADLSDDELALLRAAFDDAREGRADALAGRLDRGLPVDLVNDSGDTLLILAAYHAHEGVVRLLLDRGADHSRVNDRGQTAIGAAVFRQREDIVRALLAAGADPDLGRQSGRAVAAFFDLPQMAALLPA